jgi:DNA-binding protein HU-beta
MNIRIYRRKQIMNQKELVTKIAEVMETTKKDAKSALEGVLNALESALKDEGKVKLVGFGTFEVKDVAERKGMNPSTREEIVIPAGKRVSFKASKVLKDVVKGEV